MSKHSAQAGLALDGTNSTEAYKYSLLKKKKKKKVSHKLHPKAAEMQVHPVLMEPIIVYNTEREKDPCYHRPLLSPNGWLMPPKTHCNLLSIQA